MIKVEFFGNYRLEFKVSEVNLEAKNIKEMLEKIILMFPKMKKEQIKRASVFVNDVAIQGIFSMRHKLKEGDIVLMMYPSGGG